MFKELLFSYETMTTLVILVVSLAGIYWKVKIDLTAIKMQMEDNNRHFNLKIAEIECDRKERWDKYNEKQEKQDVYFADLLKGMNEVKVDVKGIKTNVEWLKKN